MDILNIPGTVRCVARAEKAELEADTAQTTGPSPQQEQDPRHLHRVPEGGHGVREQLASWGVGEDPPGLTFRTVWKGT